MESTCWLELRKPVYYVRRMIVDMKLERNRGKYFCQKKESFFSKEQRPNTFK